MVYGILLWGKSDNVEKIAKLQKRAIRTISFSRPIAHTGPLFKTFSLLKFNDIYTLSGYSTQTHFFIIEILFRIYIKICVPIVN